MAEDDIERLLREINATNSPSPSAQPPATQGEKAPAVRGEDSSGGGRIAFAGIAAVTMGAGTFVFGVLTPFTDAFQMGFGGAIAAFVTGLVAGPPPRFSS